MLCTLLECVAPSFPEKKELSLYFSMLKKMVPVYKDPKTKFKIQVGRGWRRGSGGAGGNGCGCVCVGGGVQRLEPDGGGGGVMGILVLRRALRRAVWVIIVEQGKLYPL